MPDLSVKVLGLAELEQALDQLTPKIAKNVARAALREAAKPVLEEARRLVPKRSGKLAETLRITTAMRNGVPKAFVKVGPSGKKNREVYYARFVEYGAAKHRIIAGPGKMLPLAGGRKFASHPGVRKKPFMRPAADSQAAAAVRAFGDKMRQRLTKEGIEIPDSEADDDSRD